MRQLMALLHMALAAAPSLRAQREVAVTQHASGPFDVKSIPQAADDAAGGPFGRLFLDKHFHGDLEATSKGQMLGARTSVEGSAGYVALELVSGNLKGRHGSFMLQHSGTMTKGISTMTVSVVPDSGTEQLTGLAGTMTIIIARDKHSYEFTYTLDGARP